MVAAAAEDMGTVLREARRNVFLLDGPGAARRRRADQLCCRRRCRPPVARRRQVLATAPLTAYNVGMALGVILVAMLSRLLGRRYAFMIGAAIAAIGGLVATAALFRESFWLFAAGLAILGSSNGFTQKLRFAAADASPSFYKPKAISWILGGGIVSAILGPQIVILAGDYFAPYGSPAPSSRCCRFVLLRFSSSLPCGCRIIRRHRPGMHRFPHGHCARSSAASAS